MRAAGKRECRGQQPLPEREVSSQKPLFLFLCVLLESGSAEGSSPCRSARCPRKNLFFSFYVFCWKAGVQRAAALAGARGVLAKTSFSLFMCFAGKRECRGQQPLPEREVSSQKPLFLFLCVLLESGSAEGSSPCRSAR